MTSTTMRQCVMAWRMAIRFNVMILDYAIAMIYHEKAASLSSSSSSSCISCISCISPASSISSICSISSCSSCSPCSSCSYFV